MMARTMNSTEHRCTFRRPCRVAFCFVLFAGLFGGRVEGQDPRPAARAFHIGFSSSLFTDINVSDATAALRVWMQSVAKERHVETDPDPWIPNTGAELSEALRSNRVDAVEVTAAEYAALTKEAGFDPLFMASSGGQITEEYVLVVHRDSNLETLSALRGRRLNLYAHYRACLAQEWLDNLLVGERLPPTALFFSQITSTSKLAQVVLPVFFRQCDACLVTRSGFEIMCELNPQLNKQLKVIATSPAIVPAVFCFRADVSGEIKEPYVAALRELHQHPAGQQVLTIFHRDKLEEHPASCMQSALDLVDTHRRLCEESNQVQVTTVGLILRRNVEEGAVK
jgi:phosphonate transport system substrate-binding protein